MKLILTSERSNICVLEGILQMLDLSEVTSGLHASALDTAGYLGAIMERIGEARYQRIVSKMG